jgi:hypothetical protein
MGTAELIATHDADHARAARAHAEAEVLELDAGRLAAAGDGS